MEVYPTDAGPAPPVPERRDPVARRPNVRALKDALRIEEVVASYGEFKLAGSGRLLGRCVSPHHEDRTPSMSVYTTEQRFKCFGCGEHGDVLDLARLAEGCELHEAMVLLSTRYGVELPGRPDSWHRKRERQAPVRDGLDELRIRRLQNTLYKMVEPFVTDLEDAERAWRECLTLAALWHERMKGGADA